MQLKFVYFTIVIRKCQIKNHWEIAKQTKNEFWFLEHLEIL